jgi:hypothetical protein
MSRVRFTAALAAAVLAAGLSANSLQASDTSGVRGIVLVSHGCPGPIRLGQQPCGFPRAGVVVRIFRGNAVAPIHSGRTDRHGRFAFPLAAGRYVLRVELKLAKPRTTAFTVKAASWTKLSLSYLIPPYME